MRVGVVSDTHGLLRPRVFTLLQGSDLILHAGDVGSPGVLSRLKEIAPVEAVRGNVDTGPDGEALPILASGDLDGLPFRMIHRREDVDSSWAKSARLVVFGHSHRPELEWRGACLFLNPGAVGPRRFSYPLTLAILTVSDGRIVPEILAVE